MTYGDTSLRQGTAIMARATQEPKRTSALRVPGLRTEVALLLLAVLVSLGVGSPTARGAVPGAPPFAWTVERVVTNGDTGWYTSIALDGRGDPYIAYVDATNGTVNVVHEENWTWVSEHVDGPGSFDGHTNIAIAADGSVHVAYYDEGARAVKYGERGSSGWTITTVDTGFSGGYVSMALTSDGRPAIVYVAFSAAVRYALWNGTVWSRETIDASATLPRYVDIVLDSANRPYVSYYADGTLRYATKVGGVWSLEVADPTPSAGLYSRICLDSLGVPAIAYYDSVNHSLRWATDRNGRWTHTVLDGSGDAGWDISLSTDADGHAQIAYYARISGSLRFALNTTLGWVLETADVGGVVGWYTGIATDAAGFPHISYYDWTNGDLRYAVGRIGVQTRTAGTLGLTGSAVTLQGELVALGYHVFVDVGFDFRAVGAPLWLSLPLQAETAAGLFRTTVTNLTPGEAYEFRAVATAGNETSLGDVVSFIAPVPVAPPPPYLAIAAVGGTVAVVAAVAIYLWVRRLRRREPGPH